MYGKRLYTYIASLFKDGTAEIHLGEANLFHLGTRGTSPGTVLCAFLFSVTIITGNDFSHKAFCLRGVHHHLDEQWFGRRDHRRPTGSLRQSTKFC